MRNVQVQGFQGPSLAGSIDEPQTRAPDPSTPEALNNRKPTSQTLYSALQLMQLLKALSCVPSPGVAMTIRRHYFQSFRKPRGFGGITYNNGGLKE